jgi:hypothetical protein
MADITTDPKDPRLGHGVDAAPTKQNEAYLVLSEEERAKGFVRPVRRAYVHVGAMGPKHPLQDLTPEDVAPYKDLGYVKFEAYPDPNPDGSSISGRYWTQAQLDNVGKGCGCRTTMGQEIVETYARDPKFYGSTYCCGCQRHIAVDEFEWDGTHERVGS